MNLLPFVIVWAVLATVVSRPTDTRAILDSGSKALAADLCPLPGHGGYPHFSRSKFRTDSPEVQVVQTMGRNLYRQP